MKTIYTQIDGKYYQMNQSTKVPLELVREEHGITSKVVVDAGDKRLIQNVVISTIDTTGTKSNKEMYKENQKKHKEMHEKYNKNSKKDY